MTVKTRLAQKYKVVDSGCFEWIGHKHQQGYGLIYFNHKIRKAHRIMYSEYVGPIPDGMIIRHTCDNPSCVNPDHLLLGTQAENIKDRHSRNRNHHPKGELNVKAKLSKQDVDHIRSSTFGSKQLATYYDVSVSTIDRVRSRATWNDA